MIPVQLKTDITLYDLPLRQTVASDESAQGIVGGRRCRRGTKRYICKCGSGRRTLCLARNWGSADAMKYCRTKVFRKCCRKRRCRVSRR